MAAGTQSAAAGADGFFSRIGDSIARTVDNVLPVWAANQLGLQQQDQTRQPVFVRVGAPPRVDDNSGSAQNFTGGVGAPNMQTVVIIGGAALAGIVLASLTK